MKAHISMLSRVIVGFLIFAAGAGAAWYFKSIVSLSEVSTATASNTRGSSRAIEVVVSKVKLGPIVDTYEALGTANANEAVTITTKVAGLVKSVNFDGGQMVKKGDVLVELDDREARASLAAAVAQARNARLLYERALQLIKSNNVPQARVDELLSSLQGSESQVDGAKARLSDLRIVAPFDGRLGLRRISPGSLVTQNSVITTLDDTSIIKLDFSLPETLLSKISVGSTVATHNDVHEDRRYEGIVKTINSRIDPITRAVEIRAEVPNPDSSIKPGMLMTVDVVLSHRDNAMVIPEAALVPEGTEQYVYKIEDDRAVRTQVRLGVRRKGAVEITDGLSPNDQVVVGGVQKIRNGVRVKITEDVIAEG
jgi:membrane fusion protein (multidrug efflux system)